MRRSAPLGVLLCVAACDAMLGSDFRLAVGGRFRPSAYQAQRRCILGDLPMPEMKRRLARMPTASLIPPALLLPSLFLLPHFNPMFCAGRWPARHMPEQVTTCEVAQCEGNPALQAKTRKVDSSGSDGNVQYNTDHGQNPLFISAPLTHVKARGLRKMACTQSPSMHFGRGTLWSDPGTTRSCTRRPALTGPKTDLEIITLMSSASDILMRSFTPHSSALYAADHDGQHLHADGPLVQGIGQEMDRY
jgi:hypothetical protein